MTPFAAPPFVRRLADLEEASRLAAEIIAQAARRDVRSRGAFSLALSGGGTPLRLFELLAEREDFPWPLTDVFQIDERIVPRSDPRSNWRAITDRLLSRVPALSDRLFPMPAEEAGVSPEAAAERYEETLRRVLENGPAALPRPVFGGSPGEDDLSDGQDEVACPDRDEPAEAGGRLDLVLLGMGADGHVASLFPGRPLGRGEDRGRLIAAEPAPGLAPLVPRLTMTLSCLNRARRAVFLVQGKAETLARALAPGGDLPAARVRPRGELLWLVAP